MTKQAGTLTDQNSTKARWLLLIGVILVGANLRVPITSVGALITFIREDLGISNASAGMITTLPLIAFALLSPFAPRIANKIGMEWTIALSLVLLITGMIVRSIAGIGYLFTGTIFVGLAIAIGNVLIPGIIKMSFPLKIGIMTGVYAVFMNIFGALGSGLSVPISSVGSMGWQGALNIWGIITIIALLIWLPQLRKHPDESPKANVEKDKKTNLWRSPIAWSVTLFITLWLIILKIQKKRILLHWKWRIMDVSILMEVFYGFVLMAISEFFQMMKYLLFAPIKKAIKEK
ncbi:MFS transporter [Oceanobacillus sp. FSL W8-0428]|uniref:MFS transporter n=1 Tax=Oceanobacillus sp. FSL W8-0428 TaxID=2921715 RepID=UPI0030FB92DC